MSTLTRWLLVAAAAASLVGCAVVPASTDAPYPVSGNPVNPTPVAAYRVECTTVPAATYWLLTDFATGCRQVLVPSDTRVVIRTKG